MKERIIFGVLGGLVGYFIATIAGITARANVHVRPELANVSWWEALLARHFTDWLFFHYSTEMTIALCIVGFVAGMLFGWWIES